MATAAQISAAEPELYISSTAVHPEVVVEVSKDNMYDIKLIAIVVGAVFLCAGVAGCYFYYKIPFRERNRYGSQAGDIKIELGTKRLKARPYPGVSEGLT